MNNEHEPMSRKSFEMHSIRLAEQWGSNNFSGARLRLIYQDCEKLTEQQYIKIVDHFLRTFRYAPLPKDFTDEARKYADFNYAQEKAQRSAEYKSALGSKEISTVAKALIEGLDGNTEAINKVIRGLEPLNKSKCKECNDSGLVFAIKRDGSLVGEYAFNCFCKASQKMPALQTWGRRFNDELENKAKRKVLNIA